MEMRFDNENWSLDKQDSAITQVTIQEPWLCKIISGLAECSSVLKMGVPKRQIIAPPQSQESNFVLLNAY
jgi:hypothetical protein